MNSYRKKLERIIKNGYGVKSGVYSLIDPRIEMKIDERGEYQPVFSGLETEVTYENLLKVDMMSDYSPDEDQIAQQLFSRVKGIKRDPIIGYYSGLFIGHVAENDFRKNGSSGGITSWILVELLKQKKIDGVIHVQEVNPGKNNGILFKYVISRSEKDIKKGAKSRYYPMEMSEVLKIVKSRPGKYAIVGIPEFIMELRLLALVNEVIRDRIKYTIGLICGHQKTANYAEALAWQQGIEPGNLKRINFRVKQPQSTASNYLHKMTGIIDGKKVHIMRGNSQLFAGYWPFGFFKSKFSDFSDNVFNEVADVVLGDAWLSEYESDGMGNNVVIIRNDEIGKLITSGVTRSALMLNDARKDQIINSQLGLVHHARDELPFRLFSEKIKLKWVPKKRVGSLPWLSPLRSVVQILRYKMSTRSHQVYITARKKEDWLYFERKMGKLIKKYKFIYKLIAIRKKGILNVLRNKLRVRTRILNTLRRLKRATRIRTRSKQTIAAFGRYLDRREYGQADGAILTLTGYFNYGNVLQRYALQKFLSKNGYKFISYVDSYSAPRDIYRIGRKTKLKTPVRAVKRFLNYQKPYWYIPKYSEIYPEAGNLKNIISFVNKNIWIKPFDPNDDFNTYIVGSDQVWRNWWGDREVLGYYFFNFLKGRNTKRIAYAASFGKDKIEEVMNNDELEYIRPYIESFDRISVREKSGAGMIKKVWGIGNVDQVLDPTLLLKESDYSELINSSDLKYEKIQPIFTYVLGETPEIKDFIHRIQDDRQQSITSVRARGGIENDILPPVELWLKGFRDAELAVTNSFHGMVLSIINNTDFIIIGREAGGLSRIKDFLSEYGLNERFVDEENLKTFDSSKLKSINWKKVNKKLKERRKESSEWLLKSLK
jgi:coenzyme F420 hydrogenase subunit beta